MTQKDIFLEAEGDAWFRRNQAGVATKEYESDPVTAVLKGIVYSPLVETMAGQLRLLEVGCGEGRRLQWLASELGVDAHGIEPSELAVEQASGRGLNVIRGTADHLPYDSAYFDVVLFGFCLYLCDPQDLFRIAAETDRVTKPHAWVVIHDFFSPHHIVNEYRHRAGVFSRKMDFRKLFDWHPDYTCVSHEVRDHDDNSHTDQHQNWVAVSALRKTSPSDA